MMNPLAVMAWMLDIVYRNAICAPRGDFPGVIPLYGIVPENQGPPGIAFLRQLPRAIMGLTLRKMRKNVAADTAIPCWD